MGCVGCKQNKEPYKVHIKKCEEIYTSYLKNQNKDPKTYFGSDTLTPEMKVNLAGFARTQSESLVQIIKMDKR
jgi:hypothetical protein